jgi:hypothetical protein
MVLFRALVMLSCLVLIPMAAIFGSAFPNLIQCCLPDSWRAVVTNTAGSVSGDAPPFGPSRASLAAQSDPALQWPSTPSASDSHGSSPSAASLASAPTWPDAEGRTSGSVPVRRTVANQAQTPTAGAFDKQGNVPAVFSAPAETSAERPRSVSAAGANIVPGAAASLQRGDSSARATSNASTAPAWPSAAGSTSTDSNDRFTSIEQRLRSYGAMHYHLETWGTRGELYRFQCQMPAAAAGSTSPSFEAVDSNALEAMQRVLQQIETLRSTARQ